MSEGFNPGDTVKLKSGGPIMTVESVGPEAMSNKTMVFCTWFDGSNRKSDAFLPALLKHT